MKKDKKIIRFLFFTIAFLVLSITIITPSVGASPKKVAVFPFTMNSKDDLSFLQKGLFSMLSSRLTDPGKVMVLDREVVDAAMVTAQKHNSTKGALNVSKARILGANLGVDYILFGSMTHFGDSFSIDGSMVDVTGAKPTVSFFEQSNSLGDAIPLVNTFAEDVNQKVFNRSLRNNNQAPQNNSQAQQNNGGFQNLNNERTNYQDQSPFINVKAPGSKEFKKRFRTDEVLNCIATGDLDNDGQIEVVTATDHEIIILQPQGSKLIEKKKIEYKSSLRIVAIDIADINGNDFPEIFLTAFSSHRKDLDSFIVEYNKDTKEFQTIAKNEPYYFRIIGTNSNDKTLFAQKEGRSPFNGKIYKMTLENNQYVIGERIKLPRNVSLLSLTKGIIGDKDIEEYIMINESGFLSIINQAGKIEWKSREKRGGSKHFFLKSDPGSGTTDLNRSYLQPRLMIYDKNKDGNNELFIIHNIETKSVLKTYKKFVKAAIEIDTWNEIALSPISKTRTVQGWISDFAIADSDKDGTDELIVSVVESEKTSAMTGSNRSYIISYDLK